MIAAVAAAPLPPEAIIWEIGGDAAREGLRKEGLGAFWYGLWWSVPLTSVPGLDKLHITCLELLELGLGVVVAGPMLASASRVRLVSDALVAVLLLRTRDPEGRLARDAKSRAMIAVHEVLMSRAEWIALHEPIGRVDVVQRYGELMLLHDAASRQQTAVIRDVCKAMGVVPRRLQPLPDRADDFLRSAVAAALDAMREDDGSDAKAGPSASNVRKRGASSSGGTPKPKGATSRSAYSEAPSAAVDPSAERFLRQ